MKYPRYHASLQTRIRSEICWYINLFLTRILPELPAILSLAALFILLPLMAAFVV